MVFIALAPLKGKSSPARRLVQMDPFHMGFPMGLFHQNSRCCHRLSMVFPLNGREYPPSPVPQSWQSCLAVRIIPPESEHPRRRVPIYVPMMWTSPTKPWLLQGVSILPGKGFSSEISGTPFQDKPEDLLLLAKNPASLSSAWHFGKKMGPFTRRISWIPGVPWFSISQWLLWIISYVFWCK